MPQLIYTNGGDVMMADIHGRLVRTLVPSQGRGYSVGVACHWHSQTVFWTDTNTQKVSPCDCSAKLQCSSMVSSQVLR